MGDMKGTATTLPRWLRLRAAPGRSTAKWDALIQQTSALG